MAIRGNHQFTRLHAQIVQEDGAFTVNVRMLNHENTNNKAWGQEIAVSIDMASAMIESIAKQFSILQNCISIKIVMKKLQGRDAPLRAIRENKMLREQECTLHRQRAGSLDDWLIDQGSAEEMIQRIMDQPKGMRSEYTIMQSEKVYQPAEINSWAQQFGLGDIPKADDNAGDGAKGAYFGAEPTVKI